MIAVRRAARQAAPPAALALVWLVLTLPGASEALAQEEAEPLEVDAAITAVRGLLTLENTLLAEDRAAHAELSLRRKRAVARLAELQNARDAAVAREDAAVPVLLERLNVQIEQAEGERAEVEVTERMLVESVRDRMRRIAILDEQLAGLQAAERPLEGALSGRWEVSLLPGTQRGTFELRQTGTVVSGVYRLTGGFTGSLRGTLVKTKVFMERIDSQLGRSMAFEGYLSADGNTIRGTWRNYELADGEAASSGQWSARRKTGE